jgi:hypothetical protein
MFGRPRARSEFLRRREGALNLFYHGTKPSLRKNVAGTGSAVAQENDVPTVSQSVPGPAISIVAGRM